MCAPRHTALAEHLRMATQGDAAHLAGCAGVAVCGCHRLAGRLSVARVLLYRAFGRLGIRVSHQHLPAALSYDSGDDHAYAHPARGYHPGGDVFGVPQPACRVLCGP